jgi:hypothetical protein
MELSLSLPRAPDVVRRDWANTDWKLYNQIVTTQLRENTSHALATPIMIDRAIEHLIDVLIEITEIAIPKKIITHSSKPGYTVERKRLKAQAQRARRRAKTTRREEDWETFHQARHKIYQETAKLSTRAHRARVEDTTQSLDGFWRLARWARSRGNPRPTFTPALHTTDGALVDDPDQKAKLFQSTLFPATAEADLSDLNNYQYPPALSAPRITLQEVIRAVEQAAPRKAPGPDGIPNEALQ